MTASARRAVATGAAVLGLVAAGVTGGWLLHSPDERIAVTVPPTVVTADVRSATLTTRYEGDGTFSAGGVVAVHVAPPSGMTAVVTAAPRSTGDVAEWCSPVVEVSGRPVLVLHGDIPPHRDLTVGDTGADVRRLQSALRECGQHVTVDGSFGQATAAALTQVYRRAGYAPVTSALSALQPMDLTSAEVASPDGGGTASTVEQVLPKSVTTGSEHTDLAEPFTTVDREPPLTPPAPASGPTALPSPSPSPAPTVLAPRGELLFVPSPPRVASVAATGLPPAGSPLVTLTLEGDRFRFALSAAQRAAVTAGTTVVVSRAGWSETTTLPDLPDVPTIDDTGSPTYPVELVLTTGAPSASYGQPGRFDITVGSPDPYELVVPVSAVYDTSDGTVVLRATGADGSTPALPEKVKVRVVASAEGHVALEVVSGSLHAGDQVVVGER
ncbi:hypothetical protein LFM56_01415 [Cellulomonas iranensis]|uniref:hypothetical protein n=1 Tax=Cellulomonas iranensis TaxID=76862 RepID=UPI001CF3E3C7|nr:hypothetical protein [Cellulomonas iranensis]UCN15017.1 hypothetical protein LFM56_01415 [Cellulomonas iranensis]